MHRPCDAQRRAAELRPFIQTPRERTVTASADPSPVQHRQIASRTPGFTQWPGRAASLYPSSQWGRIPGAAAALDTQGSGPMQPSASLQWAQAASPWPCPPSGHFLHCEECRPDSSPSASLHATPTRPPPSWRRRRRARAPSCSIWLSTTSARAQLVRVRDFCGRSLRGPTGDDSKYS